MRNYTFHHTRYIANFSYLARNWPYVSTLCARTSMETINLGEINISLPPRKRQEGKKRKKERIENSGVIKIFKTSHARVVYIIGYILKYSFLYNSLFINKISQYIKIFLLIFYLFVFINMAYTSCEN